MWRWKLQPWQHSKSVKAFISQFSLPSIRQTLSQPLEWPRIDFGQKSFLTYNRETRNLEYGLSQTWVGMERDWNFWIGSGSGSYEKSLCLYWIRYGTCVTQHHAALLRCLRHCEPFLGRRIYCRKNIYMYIDQVMANTQRRLSLSSKQKTNLNSALTQKLINQLIFCH